MAQITTKNCRVRIVPLDINNIAIAGAASYDVLATQATVDIQAPEIDVTNFESLGFEEFLTSYLGAHISVDGFYDSVNSPFLFPGGAPAGTPYVCAGNHLYIRVYATRFPPAGGAQELFDFPKTVVTSVHAGLAVKDAARISFTARVNGTFTYPTGLTFGGF